jgi:hypothetical protein
MAMRPPFMMERSTETRSEWASGAKDMVTNGSGIPYSVVTSSFNIWSVITAPCIG